MQWECQFQNGVEPSTSMAQTYQWLTLAQWLTMVDNWLVIMYVILQLNTTIYDRLTNIWLGVLEPTWC